MRIQFTLQNVMGFTNKLSVACRQLGIVTITFFLYSYQTVQAQTNLALGKPVLSSPQVDATIFPNSNLTDGNASTFAHTSNTAVPVAGEWFQIDLGADYYIERIVIKNRTDASPDRARRFMLVTYPSTLSSLGAGPAPYVDDSRYNKLFYGDLTQLGLVETIGQTTAVKAPGVDLGPAYTVLDLNVGIHLARTVFILSLQDDYFNLADVEVYGTTTLPVRTFVNTGFESTGPAVGAVQYYGEGEVPGWSTTDGIADLTGSFYAPTSSTPGYTNGGRIELWGTGAIGVPSFEGGKHAELNAFFNGELSQEPICVLPGETFNWSLAHRGRDGVDVMRLRIDNIDVAEFSDNNVTAGTHSVSVLTPATTTAAKLTTTADGWTQYTGTWTNTSGSAKTVQFAFRAVSSATGDPGVGNFLDAVSITGLQATVSFDKASGSGPESVATANLPKLLINGAITAPQTVEIDINAGSTATRGTDYTSSPTTGVITVTIPVGTYDGTAATAILLAPFIQIQSDAVYPEPDETIILSLQNPSSGLVLPTGNSCGLGETTSTYTITDTCPPTAQITVSVTNATVCSGDAVNITYTTVPEGSEVHWTRMPGNVTGTGNVTDFPSATGTAPETYTYTATVLTAGGCPSQTVVTGITVNPIPIVTPSIDSQTICSGQAGNITFVSNVPGSTIHWLRVEDNLAGTGDISEVMNTAGNFTYKIWAVSEAPASCPSSTTITCEVVVNACEPDCDLEVSVIAAASTNCVTPNGSFTITYSGSGSYQYSLNGGANTAMSTSPLVVSNLAPGSYTLVVSDVASTTCSSTQEFVIFGADVTVYANSNSPICATNTLELYAIGSGGSGTLTYNWSGPNGFSNATQNTAIANVSPAATGVYTVQVSDEGGCTITASTTVTVANQPSLTISSGAGSTICSGQSTTLLVGGENGATVSWSNNLGESGTGTSIETGVQENRGTQPGVIVYTVVATAGGSCTDIKSFSLVVNPAPIVNVVPISAVYCSIEQVKLTATASGTGTTINWSRTPATPNPPADSGSGVGSVTIEQTLPAGAYTYQFTAVGTNGCTSQPISVPITVQQ